MVLDLMMPGVDGLTVLRQRAESASPPTRDRGPHRQDRHRGLGLVLGGRRRRVPEQALRARPPRPGRQGPPGPHPRRGPPPPRGRPRRGQAPRRHRSGDPEALTALRAARGLACARPGRGRSASGGQLFCSGRLLLARSARPGRARRRASGASRPGGGPSTRRRACGRRGGSLARPGRARSASLSPAAARASLRSPGEGSVRLWRAALLFRSAVPSLRSGQPGRLDAGLRRVFGPGGGPSSPATALPAGAGARCARPGRARSASDGPAGGAGASLRSPGEGSVRLRRPALRGRVGCPLRSRPGRPGRARRGPPVASFGSGSAAPVRFARADWRLRAATRASAALRGPAPGYVRLRDGPAGGARGFAARRPGRAPVRLRRAALCCSRPAVSFASARAAPGPGSAWRALRRALFRPGRRPVEPGDGPAGGAGASLRSPGAGSVRLWRAALLFRSASPLSAVSAS